MIAVGDNERMGEVCLISFLLSLGVSARAEEPAKNGQDQHTSFQWFE